MSGFQFNHFRLIQLRVLIVIFILSLISCTERKETEEKELKLEGTWTLYQYIDHDNGGTEWIDNPEDRIFLKHITPTHFNWVSYDINKNTLLGTGGGTYVFDGISYIENIEFFFPAGSSELGQAIPFSVEMKDGQWFHTGYAKVMQFNSEKGENIVIDSSKIEETWIRVEDTNNYLDLVGTWQLVSHKNEGDSIWTEYPDFVGYLKHVTPTHFNWIYYDIEGDEVNGEGGGTYTLSGNKYIENILYSHNTDIVVGTKANFTYRIDGNKWYHNGYVKVHKLDPENNERDIIDSIKIEEIWQRYGTGESM